MDSTHGVQQNEAPVTMLRVTVDQCPMCPAGQSHTIDVPLSPNGVERVFTTAKIVPSGQGKMTASSDTSGGVGDTDTIPVTMRLICPATNKPFKVDVDLPRAVFDKLEWEQVNEAPGYYGN